MGGAVDRAVPQERGHRQVRGKVGGQGRRGVARSVGREVRRGGGCTKWTDRWAEAGGGQNRWGEKWEEQFKGGMGTKHGEVWSQPGGGDSYSRKWGEEHEGQGWVHKWGSSTSGEHWDTREQSGTYYNPVPHFGWDLAVSHSKQLLAVEQLPKEEEPGVLGPGFSSL